MGDSPSYTRNTQRPEGLLAGRRPWARKHLSYFLQIAQGSDTIGDRLASRLLSSRLALLMNTTSSSLLDRLKQAKPDDPDWQRLRDIYVPLIRRWLGAFPDLHDEADDLAQEVFLALIRDLPAFERRRTGSFRAWLRQVTTNRVRANIKARRKRPAVARGAETEAVLAQLEDPESSLSRQWEQDHDRHVFQRLLEIVRPDFEAATWTAFTQFTLDDRPAARVAKELGMSESAVVQAKHRVLKRLREEAGVLID
jgi:RNA polymerase sigma-70 factor, ECF subfamily